MKFSPTSIFFVAVLAVGSIFLDKLPVIGGWFSPPSSNRPSPSAPSDLPDLLTVFKSSGDLKQAREHSLIASRLCATLAESIRQDQALEPPGFTTGFELNELRLASLQYLLKGWKFGDTYKNFDATVGGFLSQRTKGAEGELTIESRDQWAKAFDDLSVGFYNVYLDLFRVTGGK